MTSVLGFMGFGLVALVWASVIIALIVLIGFLVEMAIELWKEFRDES